ncbi:hypothetical protein LUZ63_013275 [Rhynchospora breviuscula]|uniref:WAT1-related protein n=1 Tax=Rhynchospora breviuscula TaxID=2022672 RepID=A0A9Q0C8F4_9POAL|nr:hypothetical protein LUZ63_013275 [Rhynchospora breviuscula]
MEEEQKQEGGLERWKPAVCMVLVQAFMTGMILLSKIVITEGMFIFALLTYRSLFGALFILPFAFFFERGAWKMLALRSVGWISLNAFLGYAIPMGLYYYGLQYTTSSYSVIFTNVIPIATYILALIFRMETLRLCTLPGSAKFIGALICFGGTMLVSLYKGRALHLWPTVIGAFATAVKYSLNSYAVQKRGPSYPAMFNALSVLFTTFFGSLLLGDDITIGSILGVIFIIGGLYLFLYGKGKDLHCGDDTEEKSAV